MVLEVANIGRVGLADVFRELDYKIGVEVGVAAGWYSTKIMERNPQLLLYGIDPWISYEGYTDYKLKSTFKTLEEQAHARLDKYPNYKFVKEFSMDAVQQFEDNGLDFVYIDGNHASPFVDQDINEWYKKVKPGGILAGHDYTKTKGRPYRPPNNNTIAATNKFADENKLILFLLGTKAIKEGEVRDKVRSWMICK